MTETSTESSSTPRHRWQFFRAGGVDQVSLNTAADLRALAALDQKLWVALAMPSTNVDFDPETLALLDLEHDGRIRVTDILAAVAWCDATFKDLADVLRSVPEVKLSALKDDKVVAAAKHMLRDLKKPDAQAISVDDASAIAKSFADTVLNGDGIVIPESTDDADARKAIADIIATSPEPKPLDRSGKPGADQAHADAFFAAVDQRVDWLRRGKAVAQWAAAAEAVRAVRAKLEDYFTRCKIAAFDPRGSTALAGQDADFTALAARSLSDSDAELARLPLAKIDPAGRLALTSGVNPAWVARLQTFSTVAVTPLLGARDSLVAADLAAITDKLAAYETWHASEPETLVDALDPDWLEKLAGGSTPAIREQVRAVIGRDSALVGEYEQITSVVKAVRLQRDFGRILRNFVNFSDFYSASESGGAFQAGTLYLDARALRLCVPVADPAKHAALASSADSYLMYLDISRKGETRHIVSAITNGDADNIFIGRNGIFYDRKGQDWDATIVKVVANPISIREAFWTPYKKLVKVIEDNVTRRAAAADADATAKLEAVGKTVSSADTSLGKPPAPGAQPVKRIDLGTVAAIGVAIGGVGTLVGALLATMFGLGPWLPVGILAMLLLISGPAMILAWLKLRRRNLGPILDANGWAINGRARINVSFGAAMTELARLPKGSQRSLDDPYADKRTPWRRWVIIALIVIVGGSWFVGKLDDYLPPQITSIEVLGDYAPAKAKPDEKPVAPAPPPADKK